jgi:hypothetical protein
LRWKSVEEVPRWKNVEEVLRWKEVPSVEEVPRTSVEVEEG